MGVGGTTEEEGVEEEGEAEGEEDEEDEAAVGELEPVAAVVGLDGVELTKEESLFRDVSGTGARMSFSVRRVAV